MSDGTPTTADASTQVEPVASANDETISVYHLLGSVGHGGRESLLGDLIRNSPDDISHTVCGLRVRGGHADRFERLGTETVSFDAESKRDVRALWRLGRFLFGRSVDILHAHGPNAQVPGRLLAPLCGVGSVVSTVHGVESMFSRRQLQLERLTRRLDARTVAVSNGVKQSYVGDASPPQWETIHNGIDVEAFNETIRSADVADIRDTHSVSQSDTVLLNIGRYVPPKSQLDLVDAMNHLAGERSDVHLFIIGGRGAMESRIRSRVADHALEEQITVTGLVEDIHPYYALADVFVSSSVGEGLPIVQLEAMAAKLPVVATDIPGVRELVVDGETGLLVRPQDPESLAAAVLELLRSEDPSRFGAAGFERAKREFHIDTTVARYVSLYRELTGREGWL